MRLFLDTVAPEAVQVPGTALADALTLSIRTFGDSDTDDEKRGRAIVLFTDGEDHEGGLEDIVKKAKAAGVAVYAVGNGTRRGAPIPLREADGSIGYKKDREGKVVTTRLDELVLQDLALGTDGQYHRATAAGKEVTRIIQALTALDAREYGAVLRARYEERYQLPLAVALLALLAETLLGERRRNPIPDSLPEASRCSR